MNTSGCDQNSPFGSIDFLSGTLHSLAIIGIPIHVYCLYCVIIKSTENLKTFKWNILNYHVTILFFSYSITALASPYVFLPRMAGISFGVLKYFGVSQEGQVLFLVANLGLLSIASTLLFESWFHKLLNQSFKFWGKLRVLWIAIHYFSLPVLVKIAIDQIPEQNTAREEVLKHLPCLQEHSHGPEIFVLLDSTSKNIIIAFTSTTLILIAESLFFTMLTLLLASENFHSGAVSRVTLHKQSGFLGKLHLQVLIPILLLIFCAAYGVISVVADYFNPVLNNVFIISAAFHGIMSSVVLVLLHEDYRKPLLSLKKRTVKISDVTMQMSGGDTQQVVFERRNSRVVIN